MSDSNRKKNRVYKIISLCGGLLCAMLIIMIIYLLFSDIGLFGLSREKTFKEELIKDINSFTNEATSNNLDEYIKTIEGVEDVKIDKEQGTLEFTKDGRKFLLVINGLM